MKKLIFLKQEYVESKGLNKTRFKEAKLDCFKESIALFKEQLSQLLVTKSFRILKEVPPDGLLIEHTDELNETIWQALCQAEVVDVIDSIIPADI